MHLTIENKRILLRVLNKAITDVPSERSLIGELTKSIQIQLDTERAALLGLQKPQFDFGGQLLPFGKKTKKTDECFDFTATRRMSNG